MLLLSGVAFAQKSVVRWKVLTPTLSGKPGQVVDLKIQAAIDAGWHLYTTMKYPDTAEAAPSPTEISVGEKNLLSLAGRLKGTKPHMKFDEGFELNTEYWEGTATIVVPVKISSKAALGTAQAWVNFYFQTCNDGKCLPPRDERLTFTVEVTNKQSSADSAAMQDSILKAQAGQPGAGDTATAPTAAVDTAAAPTDTVTGAQLPAVDGTGTGTVNGNTPGKAAVDTYGPTGSGEEIDAARKKGLLPFLGFAALMGLIALATPCVFPMIPITVSFFTKREQSTKARAVRDAAFYSLGIIVTFSLLGLVVSAIAGATGITDFATNPWVNMLMAAIFLLLALNLFGMFEIQVPTSIMNKLNRSANKGSGVGSVMLMGLVFTLTSFTCTVPFIGTLLARSASTGDYVWPLLGSAAFAAAFSLPFFLLALFPPMLKALPKSGGWLNSVKVVMGFLEVAFVVKFLGGTDLVWDWGIFTHDFCLAIWIAISVLTTLYLIGHFRLPHDTPVDKIGPIRVLFATGFLACGFWLLTGLFGANLGEVEAQLPPPKDNAVRASVAGANRGGTAAPAAAEKTWMQDDYQGALARAKAEGKQVFVDFTGYFCTNCRWMERNMFPRQEVSQLMDKFVLVRLYTDGRNDVNKQQQKMLLDRFGTVAIPFYAVVTPDDKVAAKFDGMTRKPEQFIDFLRKGLAGGNAPLAMNGR